MSEKKDVSFEIYSDSEKMLEQIVDKYDLPDQSKALRKNFAGIGENYDESRDAFISDQPYPSWILNEFSCTYEAPVAVPTIWTYATDEREDEVFKFTDWDEPNLRWIAIKQDDTNVYWNLDTTNWVSY